MEETFTDHDETPEFDLAIDYEKTKEQERQELNDLQKNHSKRLGRVATQKNILNQLTPQAQEKLDKYIRKSEGSRKTIKHTKDKKLRGELKSQHKHFKDAAILAARAEILLPDTTGFIEVEGMEKTYKIKQNELCKNVDMNTQKKIFDLNLPDLGPYVVDYSRNGRNLIFGGQKGHLSILDTLRMDVITEFQVNQTVRDIKFLHNVTMFAVAQKKYAYIYDNTGAEMHCLRDFIEPNKLEFLPYHFLLVGTGQKGLLRYVDTSTGRLVAEHRTKLGKCDCMTQNPWNAVIHLGHGNGMVTLWTPNLTTPVVKMLCHQGPVKDIALDRSGQYMVTSGMDRKLKIWDIRKYQELQTYSLPTLVSSLCISQTGLLALSFGSKNVQVWKDVFKTHVTSPYMTHPMPSKAISSLSFQPFEDVLTIGHSKGLSNIVIPGAGEPNFDTYEANPFEDVKQRRETEVKSLLEKLRPEMITLDPSVIGQVSKDFFEELESKRNVMNNLNQSGNKPMKEKKKARGRNKIGKKIARKQKNVIDEEKLKYKQALQNKEKENKKKYMNNEIKRQDTNDDVTPIALQRFFKKQKV